MPVCEHPAPSRANEANEANEAAVAETVSEQLASPTRSGGETESETESEIERARPTARPTARPMSGVSLREHFCDLPDPRVKRTRKHLLIDILVIALCAVIAGAEDFVSIAAFGRINEPWFRERLGLALSNGIPSHDTFTRVFAHLDPKAFEEAFQAWVASLPAYQTLKPGEVVGIDGKTLRHSFDTLSGQAPLHLVSAWATSARLSLGMVRTSEKSNEITAIPELLKLLDIAGCLVSIDAMGCQKEIARQIVEQGGDYVLAVKDNQPALHQAVQLFFDHALPRRFEDCPYRVDYHEDVMKDHGRIERRRCWLVELPQDPLDRAGELAWGDERAAWKGLASIGRVECERTVGLGPQAKTSTEVRYYISTLASKPANLGKPGKKARASRLAYAVRGHWGIENRLHWVLDVAFNEDACRVRKDHAPENLAILRRMALNLLSHEKTAKMGVKNRRLRAGWDLDYLANVLTGTN